nr:cell division protein CrgA [Nocardioides panaciterrulae]
MLGCFVLGLLWICTFYVISNDISALPVFDDLGQRNLLVGIGFMAVGFVYATRWE